MSGVGAYIAMKALSQGVLINQVSVYGIVATVEQNNKARLIQLQIDFENGVCFFKECNGYLSL